MASETLRRLAALLGLSRLSVYDARQRLHADDLLVREAAATPLGRAADAVRDVAVRYRQDRIPPATRENPFPPAADLAALRRLEAQQKGLLDLAHAVRSAPFPPEDAVWERLRSARLQIDLLTAADVALIESARAVEERARALSLEEVPDGPAMQQLQAAVDATRQALAGRSLLLDAPYG